MPTSKNKRKSGKWKGKRKKSKKYQTNPIIRGVDKMVFSRKGGHTYPKSNSKVQYNPVTPPFTFKAAPIDTEIDENSSISTIKDEEK